MNDVPCSVEKEVKVIPPANAQGYTITSNQAPVVRLIIVTSAIVHDHYNRVL